MDFSRLLFLFTLIFYSLCSFANTGIAFIHGTNDHRLDANGYWKDPFVNAVSQGLSNPDNVTVIHCDFRQNMWNEEAAGCLVNQLLGFIHEKKITQLTVYTHSHGSNVLRWVLSNPVYDSRYKELNPYISEIIALAPSSGGTPLADEVTQGNVFEESLGWLLGYRNDSVKQQRVGDMAIYNEELLFGTSNRPAFPMPFRVVVGTDVTASPFTSASYCNGYFRNAGLKVTKLYLNSCSDGFLNCSSQSTAGKIWFMDTQKTTDQIPLSHNQSRHNCFGFEKILVADLASKGAKHA